MMKRLLGLLGDNTKEVSVAEKAIGGQRWVAVVGGSACFLCGGGPQKKESCRRNIVTSLRKSVPRGITSGASKADLWRYLIIFEHGGIYTDFDNAPMKGFREGDAIKDSDDAWFPLEGLGVVAQYFFAASPRHPIMYYSLHYALLAIWNLESIHNNKAPYTTGPRATKNGVILFLKAVGEETDGYIPAGRYVGTNNRSITVVGNKTNSREFVDRGGVSDKKK
jgi:hypothetical protein